MAAHGVTGDAASGIFALFQLGMSRAYTTDLTPARATCEEALARSDRYGERWARASRIPMGAGGFEPPTSRV